MKRLYLDFNEAEALMSALESYLSGGTLPFGDADEPVLEKILNRLETQGL